MKFPIVFAHRGANSFAPENSLAAFEKAIQLGCDGIELDVRYTGCGKVVVFHDHFTYRMTGYRGNVQKLSYGELSELKLQSDLYPGERIPTLPEVLELAGRDMLINIDVKKESLTRNGFEEKITSILRDMNFLENIIISSFNPIVLKRISQLNPLLHVGYIFRNRSSLMMLNGNPVQSLHPRFRLLGNRYLDTLHARTENVFAWTVDNESDMGKLISKSVDGIITNRPEIFIRLKDKVLNKSKIRNNLVSSTVAE